MIWVIGFAIFLASGTEKASYKCGEARKVKRPYGTVLRTVDCEYAELGTIGVVEYKGKVQHGSTIHFDASWRMRDSSFYLNGKTHGRVVFWDSLGNVRGYSEFKDGVKVGKEEFFHAPGVPASIVRYDSNGKEHGSWLEWWPNGSLRKDLTLNHGLIHRWLDFYPTGKPHLLYTARYRKKDGLEYERRIDTMRTWAPDGRPSGDVRDGKGEVLLFLMDAKKDNAVFGVVRETYRDSVVKAVEALDTVKAYKKLDSLVRQK